MIMRRHDDENAPAQPTIPDDVNELIKPVELDRGSRVSEAVTVLSVLCTSLQYLIKGRIVNGSFEALPMSLGKLTGIDACPDELLDIQEAPDGSNTLYALTVPKGYPYAIAKRRWYASKSTDEVIYQ